MPRNANRNNAPRGGAGPNRTDLLRPGPEAITTAPGQTYGEAAQQQLAQQAAPMGPAPLAGAPGAGAAPGGAPPALADVLAAAQAHNGPGNQSFTRPTERPNEPITHGLPMGPGAGPEALTGVGAVARDGVMQQATVSQMLQTMAASPTATTAIRELGQMAQSGRQ